MRVGIVYPRSNVDTVPCLVGAAEELARHGYDVDLLVLSRAGQPAPRFTSPHVRVRSLGTDGLADHSTARLRGLVKRAGWLPAVARAPLARGYQVLGAGLSGGSRIVAGARSAVAERPERYACVIGIDPDGLVLAHQVARGAPIAYLSLELLLSYEIDAPAEIELKARERQLSHQAAFVVVQDEARARLLADDNAIPFERLVLVPNAPPGPARRQQSRYWHARFDLPAEARVVLHAGSLGDWTGIDAIVTSASGWPEPWVLVVHTRYDAAQSSYVAGLRERADPRRVLWSLEPVPREEYEALIDGADIGVAFYVATGESSFTRSNIRTIGLSSGKLAHYLKAGLPVIVNRGVSIADEVESAGVGEAVADATAIGAALELIASDYENVSARACAFFESRLNFSQAFAEVIRRVDSLR
jgi:glycosyltransferase involved in cell wall biosynthesis